MKTLSPAMLFLLAIASPALASGTWTSVTFPPNALGTMELLSDGTVIAQAAGTSASWYKLTPASNGSYSSGTWSTIASMGTARQYTASEILPDGRLFVLGGEYSGPTGTANWTNTGEIYNPITNAWSTIARHPEAQYGDVPTQMLPNGNILAGSLTSNNTYIYNVVGNSWSLAGAKLYNDRSDEESWVKLADGSILSYDVFGNTANKAQRYIPATNTWVDAGTVPVQLYSSSPHFELGAGVRLPDGRVFFLGATSNTALYNPATNTWTTGPTIPAGLGANDAPAAVMPNGKVLFVASVTPSFNTPTVLDEFDPTTNTITAATTTGQPIIISPGYVTRMLDLPSGQVLFTNGQGRTALYTGDGSPNAAWKPSITSIFSNGDGSFTLTGLQLNGLDEGAAYGDDAEMSTNFPLVQYTDSLGHVLYARTFNWSSTGVATGNLPETVEFTPPTGIGSSYTIRVVTNGIASDPFTPIPVPEPTSLTILGLTALPLLARRRRTS